MCPHCEHIHEDSAVDYTVKGTIQKGSCDNCYAKFTAELLEDGCVIINFYKAEYCDKI